MKERIAANILNQKPIDFKIGTKKYSFNRLSLSNRDEIAVLAASIPTLDIDIEKEENLLSTAIEYGQYAKVLARIIAEASNQKTISPVFKKWFIKRKKAKMFKEIYNSQMDFRELYTIWTAIAGQLAPAFFLGIISSLKGMNHLKPTKETDQTVRS